MQLHPCVAHRGFSGRAPENTLASFRLALDQPGVTGIELDVHLSKDDIPVVIHDSTLKRTTNGDGRVRDFSAEQLSRMDAGSWFDQSFAGEGVPALDQVLELVAGKCRLNVELKGDDADPGQLAQRTVEIIRSHRLENDIIITSFNPEILRAVRRHSSSIRTGLIIDDCPPGLIDRVTELGASFLSIGFQHLNDSLMEQAARASVDVMAWTVNTAGDLRRLSRRPEAFQLCTNYPDRWLAAVQEEK
ncbi:glycerophosphodiester phosphodiesterase [Cohnella endophytica]|uniref:Glycerophosphodiester phosphodiesterase n=2 Tax=Cohnella endophytica TaxID=2419778 RepID=A0A494XYC3_9BACL|nr:glycerophosphodiester phosphodiesterase [Cohnella endophytica]